MTDSSPDETAKTPETTLSPSPPITAERIGSHAYRVRNERGSELILGPDSLEGSFSAGELLRIAIAMCNAASADARLAHALGKDFPAQVEVVSYKNEADEVYERFEVTITAPLQDLPDEVRDRTCERAQRAVDRLCTVGRTVEAGARIELTIRGDGE